ncbi:MAG: ABC transporter permease, partial [Brevibacterium sp.]|nr:ABC transporter permease [Brevibacterium sp.]
MTTPTHDLPTPDGGPDPGGSDGHTARDMDEPPKGGSFLSYLLRKLGGALTSMILVIVLGFFAFRMLPGAPV